jgi:dTDP-glucose pyrophosphorylase
MKKWEKNIIPESYTVRQALRVLNDLGIASNVLFVTDGDGRLLGAITDGDIRRNLLKDMSIDDNAAKAMNPDCHAIGVGDIRTDVLKELRRKNLMYVPVIDEKRMILNVLNLEDFREIIPVDAVIMAGGKGERLMPLTKEVPKPMLTVGDKPIIEHNVDRLVQYGVKNIHVSINYLGHKIESFFGNGDSKGINIRYIREEQPLGTIGAIGLVDHFENDTVLLMNSDLLTNIDYGNFYNDFIRSGSDMAVATVPHHVDLPYAILELDEERVISLQEKPRYTYFANAGIYLIKKDLLRYIPKGVMYNATDLMEKVIAENRKLTNYPILEYWLDIGRLKDYQKAQEDIRHIGW